MTKISVIAAAYNQEKLIERYMKSVLSQTFSDFEVIVTDDCSPDNTVKAAKSFNDSRIKVIEKPYNQGVNHSLNLGFENASGDYIIFLSADDMFENDYFETVNKIFDENPAAGVIYPSLKLIDENDKPHENQPYWAVQKQQDRFVLLNRLFMNWNVLASPGMAVRREYFKKIVPLNLSLVNHQDYSMHIRLLLNGAEPYMLETPKILYRVSENGSNLSAKNNYTFMRERFEMIKLMDEFLSVKDLELLKKIFPESAAEFKNKDLIPYYLGLQALKSGNTEKQQWGYKTIMDFISSENNYELLHKETGFIFQDQLNLIKQIKIDDSAEKAAIEAEAIRKKYKKYKKLFNIFAALSAVLFASAVIMLCLSCGNLR